VILNSIICSIVMQEIPIPIHVELPILGFLVLAAVDWITWSIWLLGLTILIVWIIVPAKEFKQIIKAKRQQEKM